MQIDILNLKAKILYDIWEGLVHVQLVRYLQSSQCFLSPKQCNSLMNVLQSLNLCAHLTEYRDLHFAIT